MYEIANIIYQNKSQDKFTRYNFKVCVLRRNPKNISRYIAGDSV